MKKKNQKIALVCSIILPLCVTNTNPLNPLTLLAVGSVTNDAKLYLTLEPSITITSPLPEKHYRFLQQFWTSSQATPTSQTEFLEQESLQTQCQ